VDQLFDRFGNLLKSVPGDTSFSDPDLQQAWDELEDFLNGEENVKPASKKASASRPSAPAVPPQLLEAYKLFGSKPGAPLEEVAKSYRRLLRIHHPDRYASDPAAFAKATEKTKGLTSAFRRIKEYEKTGKVT